jgi:hypothetical protein
MGLRVAPEVERNESKKDVRFLPNLDKLCNIHQRNSTLVIQMSCDNRGNVNQKEDKP